jgi:hypothetical protein
MAETIWISVKRRDKEGWMVCSNGTHHPASLRLKQLLEDYLQSSLDLPGSGCAVVLSNL